MTQHLMSVDHTKFVKLFVESLPDLDGLWKQEKIPGTFQSLLVFVY